ncbi:MAG: nucleotide exchange factor GrpE [Deltaproteobacteria bacterium]|nr:nucleotide exchange factor GrpE [Deltaproteobacteria bacterium]
MAEDKQEEKEKEETPGGMPGQGAEPEKLKKELEAKAKEAEINLDKYLRKCADLENYKKRAEREISSLISFANEELIKGLLQVIDNLERTLSHAKNAPKDEFELKSLMDGVELVLKNMFDVLKKFGLGEIKVSEGERFDPQRHEALSHEEHEGFKDGSVIRELQKGYLLKDRLLRPALVMVAKEPEKKGN